MNRDDIIRMAREAGMKIDSGNFADDMYVSVLYRFANLVAAAEREACAKVVEDKFDFCGDELLAADAIRARRST